MHPQLEAFVEVVRRGSVTRAARALYVTQPALTARLNALERTVATPLLVRRRGGVRMTEAGRAFLPYAERALQAVADGRIVLTELERGAAGHIAICASPIVSTYALPTILKRFSESHPGVQVAVRTGHSEEMIEIVKRDEVAVGLLRAFNDSEVEQFTLYEDELVLIVHAAHPCGDVVRLADLADEHFVLFDRASSYHELTNAMFLEAIEESHRAASWSSTTSTPRRRWSGWGSESHSFLTSRSRTRCGAAACGSSGSQSAGRRAARSSRCGGKTQERRSARPPPSSSFCASCGRSFRPRRRRRRRTGTRFAVWPQFRTGARSSGC